VGAAYRTGALRSLADNRLAAAAEVHCELLDLFARFRVENELAYRYPAIVAGVGAILIFRFPFGR
jgi:hypothetical protein